MLYKILGWALLWASASIILGVRFAHPDIPETRLFIDHWGLFVLATILMFPGYWLLMDGGRNGG